MHLPPNLHRRSFNPRFTLVTLGAVALGLFAPAAVGESFVHETPLEFISQGDFNSDGRNDVVLVNKDKGRVRIGYSLGGGIFDWADWRESGVKGVSGVSVARLFDLQRDSLAVASYDGNQLSVLDAPTPNKPTDPVSVPVEVQGPNLVLALDIPGEGNTPLADLLMPSNLNPDDNPNKVTLYRNEGGKFKALKDLSVPVSAARGNVVRLQADGPALAAGIVTGDGGTQFMLGSLASGEPTPVLIISNLPANADFVVGKFGGGGTPDVVIFSPGSPEITLYALEAAEGAFRSGKSKTYQLTSPVKSLVAVEAAKRARLLAITSESDAASLLELTDAAEPVRVQQLPGYTNKVLHGAVALADSVLLFSTMTSTSRVVSHYQVYQRKEDKFVPGSFGALASLDDRDDSTVPGIHTRIVAKLKEKSGAEMQSYTNAIPGTDVKYSMIAIPAGEFLMGSPDAEANRKPAEGPQHKVKVSPFWIGQFEVTWEQYLLYMYPDDEKKLRETHPSEADINAVSDAVTRPTKPYVDMSFGMGKSGFPAIAMTQHSANKFCHWLSAKTGHFYRLPTEAEWEYACRAGTTTAYSFGDDAAKLGDYGWFFDNSNDKYQRVGKKLPNPWGLFDMHGNVSEWTLDQFDENYYAALAGQGVVTDPWNKATKPYPHSARGGSWFDDPAELRSASRIPSSKQWKMTDPQLPKSRWWLSDAKWIGIRLVRPLKVPSPEEMVKYWTSGVDKE
jgi:formylglycine-generating enzyme required for sulfatase activity